MRTIKRIGLWLIPIIVLMIVLVPLNVDAAKRISSVKSSKAKSWDIDHNDDKNYYKVSFRSGNYRYNMRVNSSNKKITKYTKKKITKSVTYIGEEKAKDIALKHAASKFRTHHDIRYTKVKLDNDDGVKVYDIEFYSDHTEYEYEIDAVTGTILEWDVDRD